VADPSDAPPPSPGRGATRLRLPEIDPVREETELREYLGSGYDHDRLVDWEAQLEREADRVADEHALYRTSEAYLYNLTAFAMTRTKEPYLRDLVQLVRPPARLLDYGCGIGSDGLVLSERGYDVEFADFDNPSTRYLRHRLAARGLTGVIHDIDRRPPDGGFDAAFAFDVLEHVDDPFATLAAMEARAALVVVNVLEPEAGETPLHRPLPIDDLLAHARARGLRRYRVYHGRSHLVAYAPATRGRRGRLLAEAAFAAGRLRASR
jgi:SAM-dependent methyltransferase